MPRTMPDTVYRGCRCSPRSPRPIAVQPPILPFRCLLLNQSVQACYPPLVFATRHARRSFDSVAGLIPIPRALSSCPCKPFRMNTCRSVAKQRTLTPFRMNTYEKHRGVGVLLLTTHPMRMRILSERSESKDLSRRPQNVAIKGSLPAALPFALYDKSVKIRDEPHDA
jgi:hypothetical protein